MKKRASIIILLMCMGLSLVVSAQQTQKGEKQFEINMVWGYAQGSFEDNLNRPMPGIVFSFGGHTPKLPLVLSSEFGWMSYGFDNLLEVQFPSPSNIDLPASVVNVGTKNSILLTHLVARIVPFENLVKPYVEGILGFKFLSTAIDVESEVLNNNDGDIIIDNDDSILISSRFNSFTLSYGLGAGVNIQIFQGNMGFHNNSTTISMHVGVQYLLGSEADYLTENSIQPSENRITFQRAESNTNMLIPKLGFHLSI